MSLRKFKFIILLIILLIISILIVFIINFKNQTISENIQDWASFGDYIGGTLNTILSFLTLLTTIFIAFTLNNYDNIRNEKNTLFEKQKLIRELREAEYKEISKEINNIWDIVSNPDRIIGLNGLFLIYQKYTDFLKYKTHLFPNLTDIEFIELQDFFENAHKYYCENEIIILTKIPQIHRMSELIDKFHFRLQQFLIDG